jgi:hypothetical protein
MSGSALFRLISGVPCVGGGREGEHNGGALPALRRPGRTQGHGGGVCTPGGRGHGAGRGCTFGSTTPGLLALADWLNECGCTHVGMEATGVYWKPVWHILPDGDMTLILANAERIKNVPGRKTDLADATWLA